MSYSSAYSSHAGKDSGWDDEEPCGRLLTQSEYTLRLRNRSDIFTIEKTTFLSKAEAFCLSAAFIIGLWLPRMEIITINPDMISPAFNFEKHAQALGVNVITEPIDIKKHYAKIVDRPKKLKMSRIKRSRASVSGGRRGTGGGNYRSRVLNKGVLRLVHGIVSGSKVYGDIFGKGGYMDNIDAIISGTGGLKKGSDGGAGRKGERGIGFGPGFGGGFGSGSGDVDGYLDNLMVPESDALVLKKHTPVKRGLLIQTGSGITTGGRSRSSIARVVQQNMAALRYAYNRRLREKPGLSGKIRVRFAIDEFGKVIFCDVIESTMDDATFKKLIAAKIKLWVFEKIDKPGDVTEVIYPFVFSI